MYNILIYFIIAWGSFIIGFLLCAILSDSKNREYREIQSWGKEFEGKDAIHDGENYKVKGI